uniref:AB hydrolase-1 domain-containing protein n=1 Tax=Populus trichocarpa TaxID=3694 RepID=A0A2K1X3L1_POPTR
MARCLSFTAYRDWFYRYSFANAGLRSLSSNLGDGTIIHCWAQCVMRLMEAHGVHRMNLVGISYGRFVGYSMAAQFQEKIERVGVPSFFLTDLINARLNIDTKKVPDILSVMFLF